MNDKSIVLVLASNEDIHADAVISYLYDLKQEVIRIDPSIFWPENSKLIWHIDSSKSCAILNWNGKIIEASRIKAVFNRDFSFAKPQDGQEISNLLKYAESRAALYGFFRCFEGTYWMNPPWYDEMVDNKPFQYAAALGVGLKVPKTLVTNDPNEFVDFFNTCNRDVIIKQLSEICLIEEVEYPSKYSTEPEQTAYGFYTNKVSQEHLENLNEIVNSPCLFQEHIEKKADIRVTVVGDDVFTVLIDSQSCDKTKTDFRKEPFLPIRNYCLPSDVKQKLLKLMRSWNLQFSACDFVLSLDDELIFLEANVVGNWLWTEKEDSVISKTIARKLVRLP